MIGAVVGDIVGSPYERHNLKNTDFPLFGPGSRFTDDTVMSCATAEALLTDGDYAAAYRRWFAAYPDRGYGPRFAWWAAREGRPAPWSCGNGSAMRVAPVGWAFDDLEGVLREARRSAEVSHPHPEGIQGAEAVAAAVYLARTGASPGDVRELVTRRFGYRLDRTVDEIRPGYRFDATCQGSVPEALIAALGSTSFEDALRRAVSLGGDSDTIACVAGAVAEGLHGGVPTWIAEEARRRLDDRLRGVLDAFRARFAPAAATGAGSPGEHGGPAP
ncbi:MAG: ADP-ribosylglycohydrolase family protein [Deferrisomatales bacterium]